MKTQNTALFRVTAMKIQKIAFLKFTAMKTSNITGYNVYTLP
jgi:hypothetical protein